MWGVAQPEDSSGDQNPPTNQELKDLKDQFDQQQVLIAQLKEMLRKTDQTSGVQEKVEEYANTLTQMNLKVKNSKMKRDTDLSSDTVDTPAKEKIMLLRQQMEQNKLKLAERGKLHKGIEETVTQLKAQLDDSLAMNQVTLSLHKDDDYTETSSQQELYNCLTSKEKRIADLNAKIQKLEANVLDLQENVKEKDSVIDARTKAITLMTESLSKKGKSTLEALDDTKEQMRKMQENFVAFETQMKSEKEELLERLQEKTRREELPKKGRKKNQKIAEYEAKITELNLTIEELKASKIESKQEGQQFDQNLKKQLDENNKSMIKMKAQHKSKIREMNKAIEELKKDGAVEIKALQEQNAKLVEQVAKLTSNNDLATSEYVNDLEMKLLQQSQLDDHNRQTIATLENQISDYKIKVEQLEKLAQFENDQVVSEIRSIDLEEQLDKAQLAQNQLQERYDSLALEKSELLQTIENLTKEKLEISSKLDGYIQENIELIDKLEKLSSAKVSSAESIEIVEGLTQQEKLELEEYQKGLDVPDNIKNSTENLENQGLNESVNQLTEETSDLLRKIELFTEERREVMDKMEALAVENAQLAMKICELENNRDVLAETYEVVQNEKEELERRLEEEREKLMELESNFEVLKAENAGLRKEIILGQTDAISQTEIDEYKALIEIQKQEIHDLRLQLLSQQDVLVAHSNLQEDIGQLQISYENLLTENERLAKIAKENGELIHEKDNVQTELTEAKKRITELSQKLTEHLEEIANYQNIVQENKTELVESANVIAELRRNITEKHSEICYYEVEIGRTNVVINDLTVRVTDLENARVEHSQDSNQAKIRETIEKQTLELHDLKLALTNIQEEMARKDFEIHSLTKEKSANESSILKLQTELKSKDEKFHAACDTLKQKCLALQAKIDENAGCLDINLPKILELETKNKEQLDKMKKIAASLKKKMLAYQELEAELSEVVRENERLHAENVHEESSESNNLNSEISKKNEMISELSNELEAAQRNANALDVKKAELEMFIESKDAEIGRYKDKVDRLEEILSTLEERRLTLERQTIELGHQLEEKSNSYEEISQIEDILEQRLAMLISQDKKMERRLRESTNENQKLAEANDCLAEENVQLKVKLAVALERSAETERINELEEEMAELHDFIFKAECDSKKSQTNYEKQLAEHEIWEAELESERKSLIVQVEKLSELVKERDEKLDDYANGYAQQKVEIRELQVEVSNRLRELGDLGKLLEEKCDEIEGHRVEKTNLESEKRSLIEERDSVAKKLQEMTQKTQGVEVTEPSQNLPQITTFVWPESTGLDPFESLPQQPKILNYFEPADTDSATKIKTLEFMLFNAEKEKDEALAQCQELTAQIAQLIYEKEARKPDETGDPPVEVNLSKLLHEEVKFTTEQEDESQFTLTQEGEVAPPVEVKIAKSEAWFTMPQEAEVASSQEANVTKPEAWFATIQEVATSQEAKVTPPENLQFIQFDKYELESQIVTDEEASLCPENLKDIEYTKCDESNEVCESQTAYLCFKSEDENDDGWGCGSDEAKLEADYQNVAALSARVQELQVECERIAEENRAAQVKSGKLVKKLKEYKALNEKLTREAQKSGEFAELDDALRAELLEQIGALEKGVREASYDLEKERNAKVSLAKQLEAVQAANERMAESKEKQEVELLGWQRQNRELAAKLQQFEWGADSPIQESEEKGNEYVRVIEELTKDNEELQVLLEEQRNLRIEAEKADKSKQEVIAELEENRNKVQVDVKIAELAQAQGEQERILEDQIRELTNVLQAKTDESMSYKQQIVELANELQVKVMEGKVYEQRIAELSENVQSRLDEQKQVEDLQIAEMSYELQSKTVELDQTVVRLAACEKHTFDLTNDLQSKAAELDQTIARLTTCEKQTFVLTNDLQIKTAELDETIARLTTSQKQASDCEAKTNAYEQQIAELTNDLQTKTDENSSFVKRLNDEWAQRVEQRGFDVAESWKTHLQTEFVRLEQTFKKETDEWEEKCNVLVNENNELRKNVDAEIRNEVDKMAALEKQVSDRQIKIDQLNVQLCEKESELTCKIEDHNRILGEMGSLTVREEETARNLTVMQKTVGELTVEIDEYKQAIESFQQLVETKDIHIAELVQQNQIELEQLEQLQSSKQNEIDSIILETENLLSQNLDDLRTVVNIELETANAKLGELETKLHDKITQSDEFAKRITELDSFVNELRAKLEEKTAKCNALNVKQETLNELGSIIEDQVLKIEAQKRELYEKSNDYDSLIAELDMRKQPNVVVAERPAEILVENQQDQVVSPTPQEPISRAELDLALYMLHQRDVRCEELTVELIQLLEERDTLQLKLSNAIREREDLKKKNIEITVEPTEVLEESETAPLADKLLELKLVGYRRDKTILDEQEQRRLQQIAVMQDHRDIAALLPAEAAAKLVHDANYTLSRDVQSPSKVLLNWLWGRSTPKVNDV